MTSAGGGETPPLAPRMELAPGEVVRLALVLGMVGGAVEVGWIGFRTLALGAFPASGSFFVWTVPLIHLTVQVAVAGILVLARVRRGGRVPVQAAWTLLLGTAFLTPALMIPRLHPLAAGVLAAGAAVALGRQSPRRLVTAGRRLGRAGFVFGGGLIVLAFGVWLAVRRPDLNPVRPDAPDRGAPNIILIVLDTVRASDMSLYGFARKTTPNLEVLAARGVTFERALSTAPWTLPSHASMFTGRHPHELSTGWGTPLDARHPVVAEALRDLGYATVGIVANTGYCSAAHGIDRGFAHYEDHRLSPGSMLASAVLTRTAADNFRVRRLIGNDDHLGRIPADEINAAFLDWLDRSPAGPPGRPFFAFLNYYDAHGPYLPPAPFDRRFEPSRADRRISPLHRWNWDPARGRAPLTDAELAEERAAYHGALAYLDDRLARLMAALEARGVLRHTVLVITSDHGEEFGEHGVYDHGNTLYLPSLHVPLVLAGPGVPTGVRISNAVSLRDLAETLLDLADPHGTAGNWPGESLARYWRGSGPPAEPLLHEVDYARGLPEWFPVSRGDMDGLFHDGWHYIRNGDGREELYDTASDPGEQADRAGELPGRLEAFRRALSRIGRGEP